MKWKTKRERKRHYTWATERIQVFDRMRQENVLNVAQAQLTFTVQGSMTFSLNCAQVLFIYLFFFFSIFHFLLTARNSESELASTIVCFAAP